MVLHSLWNTSAGLAGGVGFLGIYASVMVPVFLALLGVVIAAMVRERHVLERYLTPEVAVGVLGPAEVAEIASPRARRRALRAASAAGAAARRARRGRHHAAIERAVRRRHCARRPGSAEPHLVELEASYVARLGELRGAADAPSLATGETAQPE